MFVTGSGTQAKSLAFCWLQRMKKAPQFAGSVSSPGSTSFASPLQLLSTPRSPQVSLPPFVTTQTPEPPEPPMVPPVPAATPPVPVPAPPPAALPPVPVTIKSGALASGGVTCCTNTCGGLSLQPASNNPTHSRPTTRGDVNKAKLILICSST